MKMIMSVISKKSGENVLNALVNAGFMATYGETRGGMLRQSQLSIFLAVQDEDVENVLEIVKTNCKTHSIVYDLQRVPFGLANNESGSFDMGNAVSFVWQLDRIEKS